MKIVIFFFCKLQCWINNDNNFLKFIGTLHPIRRDMRDRFVFMIFVSKLPTPCRKILELKYSRRDLRNVRCTNARPAACVLHQRETCCMCASSLRDLLHVCCINARPAACVEHQRETCCMCVVSTRDLLHVCCISERPAAASVLHQRETCCMRTSWTLYFLHVRCVNARPAACVQQQTRDLSHVCCINVRPATCSLLHQRETSSMCAATNARPALCALHQRETCSMCAHLRETCRIHVYCNKRKTFFMCSFPKARSVASVLQQTRDLLHVSSRDLRYVCCRKRKTRFISGRSASLRPWRLNNFGGTSSSDHKMWKKESLSFRIQLIKFAKHCITGKTLLLLSKSRVCVCVSEFF